MAKPKGKPHSSSKADSNFRPYLILAVAVLVVYGQILSFGLVQFDDHGFVLMGAENLKLSNIPAFFRHSVFWVLGDTSQEHDVFYRPVQNVVYAVCNTIASGQSWIYHLAGLLLHLAAVNVLYRFLLLLEFKPVTALFASLIYAVHPVLVQGVAWIAGMGDQLAMIFTLLSMIYFIRSFKEEPGKATNLYLTHLGFFALALFSKEIAIVMMLLCLLWFSYLNEDKSRKRLIAVSFIGWSFVVGVYFIFRTTALKAEGGGLTGSLVPSLVANGHLVFGYMEKIFLPWRLSPIPSREDAEMMIGLILIVVIMGWAIYRKRLNRRAVYGLVWFFAFLVPTFIQQNPEAHFFAFEHRLYIPLIGMILFVSELLGGKEIRLETVPGRYLATGLVVIFGVLTLLHARTFTDPYTFYDKALSASPRSVIAYNGYGKFLLTEKKYTEAIEAFKKSHEYKPDDIETTGKIAELYMKELKNPAEAATWYRRSLEIDPRSIKAAVNLADVYWQGLHDTIRAEEAYRKALSIEPGNSFALSTLGKIRQDRGDSQEGRALLQRSIEADPNYLLPYKWLAISWFGEGRIEEAVKYLLLAFDRAPQDVDVLRNLAICYYKLNDKESAGRFVDLCKSSGIELPEEVKRFAIN